MSERFSEGFYKAIFEGCSDAIYVIDPQSSRILDANTRAWTDLGMSRERLLQHSVISLQQGVENEEHWAQIAEMIYSCHPQAFTFIGRHYHQHGTYFPVEVYTSVIEFEGQPLFLSIARNLDRTSSQREAFRTKDARLTYALNEAVDGLWDWTIDTGEVFFSPQLKRMLGYLPHEMEPTLETWSEAVHDSDRGRVMAALDEHLSGRDDSYSAEYQMRKRDGSYIWVRDRGRVCQRDEAGNPLRVVGMVHDITRSKGLEDQLREQASHDHLTGLLNRRAGYIHFSKQLSYALRYNQSLTVCLIDLDHFKNINDSFGHLAGDSVLKHFAGLMNITLRKSDSLMRWGGEEFLLLLPNTEVASAVKLIGQLKEKLADNPAELESGEQISYTFSAGLACCPLHSQALDALIKCADDALYTAKGSGRDTILVSDESGIEQPGLF
ncbi:PAS domain S-box-containing protein/diguanylate cyclase (GGDEF) domain-containing protein [Amphritea atlantica]|jgi:diguanylate cyclase (GGDEF)-like protein/PAS domain S-box-containing protein|uniref:diguanylate cyclase n=1 Tax=Amphritea atlantica TaxID=355243 RepID=A0A1H9HY90_9GAMM|nr:sensor domain-containing diguanylate cyclase [Amphritea atlantica]SEQ67333.1 PAS domain S-box-containing protein/diguanylate cyclase (GGDEF) domain-containing protein [Amphritea atlantica]